MWPTACTSTTQTRESVAGSSNGRSQKERDGSDDRHDRRPAYQAYQILYIGFIAAPSLAGLDKFTFLTTWDQCRAPSVERLLPFSGHTFMLFVGLVEMAAAVPVATRPRIGA
jgi:hypothetical protein